MPLWKPHGSIFNKAGVRYKSKPVGTVAALDTGEAALNCNQVFTIDLLVSHGASFSHQLDRSWRSYRFTRI